MSVVSRTARGHAGRSRGRLTALIAGVLVLTGLVVAPSAAGAAPARTTQMAAAASSTATFVTLSSSSQTFLTPKSIRVRVTVVASNGRTPTGTLKFKVDGHTFGTAKVESNGKAVLVLPSDVAIGRHRITATYVPSGSSFKTSYGVAYATVAKAAPTIQLGLPGTNPAYGSQAKARVIITVNGRPVRSGGKVSLVESGRTIASATLNSSGQVVLPFAVTMRPGKKYVSARYTGTASVAAASKVGSFNVFRASSRVTLSTKSTAGSAATVSVKVSGAGRTPTGITTTKVAGRSYSRTLQSGSATVSASGLGSGSHSVTTTYPGDAWYRPSASSGSVSVSASPCPVTARACVDLTNSLAWIQSGGRIVYGPVPITSGRPGYRTASGSFAVYWKDKDHKSSIFNDAPMPNSVFFDGGNAFHEGSLYVPSHGCIHLSWAASEYFYNTLDYGDSVVVFGYAPY